MLPMELILSMGNSWISYSGKELDLLRHKMRDENDGLALLRTSGIIYRTLVL